MKIKPTHLLKLVLAGFTLGLLTLGILALVFSAFFDPNLVGDFFEKAFLPCQIALTVAWVLAIRHRIR